MKIILQYSKILWIMQYLNYKKLQIIINTTIKDDIIMHDDVIMYVTSSSAVDLSEMTLK